MNVAARTVASVVAGVTFFAVALFLPAGTFHYPQAWIFLAVFGLSTVIPSAFLAVHDPAALRRRLTVGPTAETRPAQRLAMTATVLSIVGLLVVSALDHRSGWSSVPTPVVVLGDVLVAAGLLVAQLVVVQNAYAAATIGIEEDQPVVSTGLYAVVRHPMYLGALIMLLGTPLALDSYWGTAVLLPATFALGARIVDEERLLTAELAGYGAYVGRVRHRLVPGIW